MDANDHDPRPWEVLLQVAGALSGLAGLVYLIGATTMWLRASLVGLPADIAVAHEPRSAVIALGIRGLVLVGLTFVGWTAVYTVIVLFRARARVKKARRAGHTTEEAERHRQKSSKHTPITAESKSRQPLRRARARAVRTVGREFMPEAKRIARWLSPRSVGLAVFDAVVIAAASFVSWVVLAIAVSGVATLGAAIRFLDPSHKNKALGFLGAGIAALAIGLGWQIRPRIEVQGVFVSPPLPGLFGYQLPYFGETSDFIYVGVVRSDFTYQHQIEELHRDKRLLTFTGRSFTYCRPNTPPGTLLWNLVFHNGSHAVITGC